MKRIDYFWPRAALQISGIVLLTQVLVEFICVRKEGFDWVLPACALAFALSCTWVMTTDPLAWAKALKAREEAGEKLNPTIREMWRSALKHKD